jgi:hypothetical protein
VVRTIPSTLRWTPGSLGPKLRNMGLTTDKHTGHAELLPATAARQTSQRVPSTSLTAGNNSVGSPAELVVCIRHALFRVLTKDNPAYSDPQI